VNQDCKKDWRELCREASSEADPTKLMSLIGELTKALDERDRKRGTSRGEISDTGD